MPLRLLSLVLTALLGLSGCNLIYKQNVQQGNALEQEDLDELYIGMNRRQVIFVLGTPSVQDPFNQDRWDYVQTFSRRGGPPVQRTVTLRFDNDALAEIIGAESAISAPIDEPESLAENQEKVNVEEEELDEEERESLEKYEKAQDVFDQNTQDDF
ncbi:MAG: outer membrane protein assembly factor BamE [Xanthomonadales bacterium]|nr:outer membrane protein assembly factor BamE [Xanthomonadales bacterium]